MAVDKYDDISSCRPPAKIARCSAAVLFLANILHRERPAVPLDEPLGPVRGPVIGDDDLIVLEGLKAEALQHGLKRLKAITHGDDDGKEMCHGRAGNDTEGISKKQPIEKGLKQA